MMAHASYRSSHWSKEQEVDIDFYDNFCTDSTPPYDTEQAKNLVQCLENLPPSMDNLSLGSHAINSILRSNSLESFSADYMRSNKSMVNMHTSQCDGGPLTKMSYEQTPGKFNMPEGDRAMNGPLLQEDIPSHRFSQAAGGGDGGPLTRLSCDLTPEKFNRLEDGRGRKRMIPVMDLAGSGWPTFTDARFNIVSQGEILDLVHSRTFGVNGVVSQW
jgi:hypothetical protein